MDYLFALIMCGFVGWLWFGGPRKARRDDSPDVKRALARQEFYKAMMAIIALLITLAWFGMDNTIKNFRYVAEQTQKGIEADHAAERTQNDR